MNNPNEKLLFIALIPPENVQKVATEIKQQFAEKYNSKAALKSPPHITLQPPFNWDKDKIELLEEHLEKFAQTQNQKVPIILDGFAAFKPRVIYINVIKTEDLLALQKNLTIYLESSLNIVDHRSKSRAFSPHVTVGFRDLSKSNFYQAWSEFEDKPLHFEFSLAKLTLLTHNGRRWEISKKFDFKIS
jgi:2'-5' RNA ligase